MVRMWSRRRAQAEARAEQIERLLAEAAHLVTETAAQVEVCATCPLYPPLFVVREVAHGDRR